MRFTVDRFRWPLLLLVVLAGLLVVPFEIASTAKVTGQVLPVREWVLSRGTGGQVVATVRNHATGAVEAYQATEIERGDAMRFTLARPVLTQGAVAAGDTVGVVASSQLDHQMAQLQGALQTTRASLALKRSGEKEAVVEAARQELLHAREQVAQQKRLLERQRRLHEQGVVSDEQIELAESTLRLYEQNVARREAQVAVVQTGSRPEDVELTEAQVRALEDEITILQERQSRNALVAPFGGPVIHATSPDTLLTVVDTSAYVVVLPVRWEDDVQPVEGQRVTLLTTERPVAHVTRVSQRVHLLGGRPHRLVIARVDSGASALHPGAVVRCTLNGDAVSLPQYLRRYLFRH